MAAAETKPERTKRLRVTMTRTMVQTRQAILTIPVEDDDDDDYDDWDAVNDTINDDTEPDLGVLEGLSDPEWSEGEQEGCIDIDDVEEVSDGE